MGGLPVGVLLLAAPGKLTGARLPSWRNEDGCISPEIFMVIEPTIYNGRPTTPRIAAKAGPVMHVILIVPWVNAAAPAIIPVLG